MKSLNVLALSATMILAPLAVVQQAVEPLHFGPWMQRAKLASPVLVADIPPDATLQRVAVDYLGLDLNALESRQPFGYTIDSTTGSFPRAPIGFDSQVGRFLDCGRSFLDLTQADIATAMGVPASRYSAYERGTRSITFGDFGAVTAVWRREVESERVVTIAFANWIEQLVVLAELLAVTP